MRRLLFAVVLAALAATVFADDAAKKCNGELFTINGKTYCMVAVDPEDYYRAADAPQKSPAPGSLVQVPNEPVPHLKLAGHLLVNGMMTEEFHADDYTYSGRTGKYGRPHMDSRASLGRESTGWGLSASWSPDGTTWVEASWQRPERVDIGIDTTSVAAEFIWYCIGASTCPARIAAHQENRHRFTVDDFALGILGDVTENKNKYFSILLGVGVHRRYLRDTFSVSTRSGTELYRGDELAGINDRSDSESKGVTKARQTRLYFQTDLELYPAGKNRWVGLVLSTRVLADGDKEQQFFTDTLNDQNVLLGIQPGRYDVTARLVLRF